MHLFVRSGHYVIWCDEDDDDDDRIAEQMGDTYLTNKTFQLKYDIFFSHSFRMLIHICLNDVLKTFTGAQPTLCILNEYIYAVYNPFFPTRNNNNLTAQMHPTTYVCTQRNETRNEINKH